MADENGKNGGFALLKEMLQTRERAAAWLYRGAVVVLITVLGYLIQDRLLSIDRNRENLARAVSDIAKAQFEGSNVVVRLDTTLQDYIRNQQVMMADHEQRLRALERR